MKNLAFLSLALSLPAVLALPAPKIDGSNVLVKRIAIPDPGLGNDPTPFGALRSKKRAANPDDDGGDGYPEGLSPVKRNANPDDDGGDGYPEGLSPVKRNANPDDDGGDGYPEGLSPVKRKANPWDGDAGGPY